MSTAMTPGRVLVIGRTLPSQATGTALVTRRLLEHFSAQEIVFMGRPTDARRRIQVDFHYPVIEVPAPPQASRGEAMWRLAVSPLAVWLGLRAVRRYRPTAILAIYPDEGVLLTGLLLKRLTGLPFLAYFCDIYLEEARLGRWWLARLAEWLQPRIFGEADRILALTGGLVQHYREHAGLSVDLIPHCLNTPIPDASQIPQLPPPNKPFVIGYSGNVNAARVKPLQQLVRIIGGRGDYELRYFSANSRESLQGMGVWAENARLAFIKDENELLRELAACDLLYLPVASGGGQTSYEQLATSFGTKSLEYFISQRPVLLHSPEDYYITRFYRENGCGYMVPEQDQAALAMALERLQTDMELRERLVRAALQTARLFEGQVVASRLRSILIQTINAHTEGPIEP